MTAGCDTTAEQCQSPELSEKKNTMHSLMEQPQPAFLIRGAWVWVNFKRKSSDTS
jgi:hypothetical protein